MGCLQSKPQVDHVNVSKHGGSKHGGSKHGGSKHGGQEGPPPPPPIPEFNVKGQYEVSMRLCCNHKYTSCMSNALYMHKHADHVACSSACTKAIIHCLLPKILNVSVHGSLMVAIRCIHGFHSEEARGHSVID